MKEEKISVEEEKKRGKERTWWVKKVNNRYIVSIVVTSDCSIVSI